MSLKNYQGGLIGVFAALTLYIVVYAIAFMTAFGNPSDTASFILDLAEVFFTLANPLWLIPSSYIVGAYLLR